MLGVHEAQLRPLSDAPNLDGMRELRYLISGRGIVVVAFERPYHETTWRLVARWSGGEAEHEVGVDTEVAA